MNQHTHTSSIRVMVVDDSQLVRTMVNDLLESNGYKVTCSSDGFEALADFRPEVIDILLVDYRMPGMNGIQLMKAVHAFSPNTPIVFLSGSVNSETAVEAMREGAIDFVGKTQNEFVLLRAMERATLAVRRQYDFIREEEARKQAESASRCKSVFLANMSHEFRTPLTAILGFGEMLLSEGDIEKAPSERIEAINTILRNGEHLLGLINNVLDISKIEADKLVIERTRISPFNVTKEVIQSLRKSAAEKGLELELSIRGNCPETISTDRTQFRQILLNLIGNAIKFTEQRKVCVELSMSDVSESDATIHFDIIDTGIGLSCEQISMLFSPFVQAEASTTRKFGGTGLGLAISKQLAQLLGSDISVSSELGQGSTFSVAISTGPLDGIALIQGGEEKLWTTTHAEPRKPQSVAAKLNCRVLVAEDGYDNQRLISFILKKAGADVTVVENGQLAVEIALAEWKKEQPFDVILMDMMMPVLDGYNATRRLRSECYEGHIVALTAYAMASDRDRCLAAGCDDYATKPIDRLKLLTLVAQLTLNDNQLNEPQLS